MRAREPRLSTQLNVDLIAGMVGETDENWAFCLDETVRLAPDSVTIYQMEVPFNTTLYRRMADGSTEVAPVADWATKRRWTAEAFARLAAEGYEQNSAYTMTRGVESPFRYRDSLWHGATMIGVGVSSFSHHDGVHWQNETSIEPYLARVEAGEAPIARAYPMDDEERLVRQFVLQMKVGRLDTRWFVERFGVDPRERWERELAKHVADGYLEPPSETGDELVCTPEGLLRVDALLEPFFLERHRDARYT